MESMTNGDETPIASTGITTTDSEGRPRWARLAMMALALAGAGPLLMFIAAMLTGSEFDGFFAITIIAAGLAIFLTTRRHIAARIVAAVLAFLFGMMLFWTVFGLSVPDSFFDFVPGVVVLPGALLAIGSLIASIVAQRRGHIDTTLADTEQKVIRVVLGIVVILTAMSAVLTALGRETADGSQADVEVAMNDFEFEPEKLEVEAGTVLLVKNKDPFLHTFTVDSLGIDVTLGPGSSELVTIPDDASGEIIFYCEPHTNDPKDPDDDHDMAGRMTVS